MTGGLTETHRPAAAAVALRGCGDRRLPQPGLCEVDAERRTGALFALDRDRRAVRLGDHLGNREAEPRALHRALDADLGAEERIEDLLPVPGAHPDARVGDLEERP